MDSRKWASPRRLIIIFVSSGITFISLITEMLAKLKVHVSYDGSSLVYWPVLKGLVSHPVVLL